MRDSSNSFHFRSSETSNRTPLEIPHPLSFTGQKKKKKKEFSEARCRKAATRDLIATICNPHFTQIHILFISRYS